MKSTKEIAKSCLLVKLSIGTYAGTTKSDKLSREAAIKHEAQEDAISTIIKAMDPEDRKDIMLARSQARAIWLKDSLPWLDNGMRLVPVPKYLKMKDRLTAKGAEFEDAVQAAVDRYEEIRAKMETRVGKLAGEANLPTKEQFARKFRYSVRTSAVGSDVRIEGLAATEVAKIEADNEALITEQLQASQRDVLARVIERLESIIEKLNEVDDPKAKGKHFKDSLIGNVKKVCDEMQSLNILGSAKLAERLDRTGQVFDMIDPEKLRESKENRQTAIKAAQKTISELDDFEF
jgi:hypothetical protein